MDHAAEIARIDQQLAEQERASQASAALREKRARLRAAEQAEAEARQRAREADEAAREVREAENDDRAAQAMPLRAEVADVEQQLAALAEEMEQYLHRAIADAGRFHERHAAMHAQRNALATRLRALGEPAHHMHALTFEAFVRDVVTRFDHAGRSRRAREA